MTRAFSARRSARLRPGLTLMELVVVLTVIVAITGIISMMLPNMVHRANIASCTATISELDKIIQTYEGMYSEIPNKMDNLVIGSGLATYVLTGADSDYGASFAPGTLTGPEAASLSEAGLTQLASLIEDPGTGGEWKPTFWPYSDSQATTPTFTNVADGVSVAVVSNAGAKLMGLPTGTAGVPSTGTDTGNYKYVIFGLNRPCTLFRNTASEPPYHFADTKFEDPATYYMCFAAIYMIKRDYLKNDGSGVQVTLPKARFMGTIAFHDFGLSTVNAHTKEWWDRLKSERPLK